MWTSYGSMAVTFENSYQFKACSKFRSDCSIHMCESTHMWSFANLSRGFLAVAVEKWYQFKAGSKFLCDWNQTSPLTSADRPKKIKKIHRRVTFTNRSCIPATANRKKRPLTYNTSKLLSKPPLGEGDDAKVTSSSLPLPLSRMMEFSVTQLSKNLPRPAAVADGLRAAAGRRWSATVRALGKGQRRLVGDAVLTY
jgi:hypothetical protein